MLLSQQAPRRWRVRPRHQRAWWQPSAETRSRMVASPTRAVSLADPAPKRSAHSECVEPPSPLRPALPPPPAHPARAAPPPPPRPPTATRAWHVPLTFAPHGLPPVTGSMGASVRPQPAIPSGPAGATWWPGLDYLQNGSSAAPQTTLLTPQLRGGSGAHGPAPTGHRKTTPGRAA